MNGDNNVTFNESIIESFIAPSHYYIKSEVKSKKSNPMLKQFILYSHNDDNTLNESTDSSIQSDADFEFGNEVYLKDKIYSFPPRHNKKVGKFSLVLTRDLVNVIQQYPKKQNSQKEFKNKLQDKFIKMSIQEDIKDFNAYTHQCIKIIRKNNSFIEQLPKIPINSIELTKEDRDDIISNKKKLCVLDLDETLVHCESNENDLLSCDKIISIKLSEQKEKKIGVNIRPNLSFFLNKIKQFYVLVLYTASLKQYTDAILSVIDPEGVYFKYILCRHHCRSIYFVNNNKEEVYYVKDLRIFNINMNSIVIVDNSILSFVFQLNNGIPILPFYSNQNDNELHNLFIYLKFLHTVKDVRKENAKSFNLIKEINK